MHVFGFNSFYFIVDTLIGVQFVYTLLLFNFIFPFLEKPLMSSLLALFPFPGVEQQLLRRNLDIFHKIVD